MLFASAFVEYRIVELENLEITPLFLWLFSPKSALLSVSNCKPISSALARVNNHLIFRALPIECPLYCACKSFDAALLLLWFCERSLTIIQRDITQMP